MEIKIGKITIGDNRPVFIIAEAGVNHNGSLDLAKRLIQAAKEAGADAVKFQTYRTEEIVTPIAKLVAYQKGALKSVKTQFELLKRLELDRTAHLKLIHFAKEIGILFLSTPGDFSSVDLLHDLGVPIFKIGSDDLTNIPLLKYVASKKKPILLSTGMANLEEIREALKAIKEIAPVSVVVMHATTLYPCPLEEVNMRALVTLKNALKLPVGYSDHTSGVSAAMAAVSLGACVIEKHITLDRRLPGPDHKASYTPQEFKVFVRLIREVEACLGDSQKQPTPKEKKQMLLIRKGIVASCDLPKDTVIKKEYLAIKRPQIGLLPKEFYWIIGKRVKRPILKNEPIRREDLFMG